jgi:hypothetical protein
MQHTTCNAASLMCACAAAAAGGRGIIDGLEKEMVLSTTCRIIHSLTRCCFLCTNATCCRWARHHRWTREGDGAEQAPGGAQQGQPLPLRQHQQHQVSLPLSAGKEHVDACACKRRCGQNSSSSSTAAAEKGDVLAESCSGRLGSRYVWGLLA